MTRSKTQPAPDSRSHTAGWLLSAALLFGLLWLNHHRQLPAADGGEFLAEYDFSLRRAFAHIETLAREPRIGGSAAHESSRAYLVQQFQQLGLETQIQKTLVIDAASGRSQTVHNILARLKIPEVTETESLLLTAHYDSVTHSPGAADDASGVAVILESLRSWLTKNPQPVRDILVLITDGEEHGLLGAKAFLQHPWLTQVGLVINLEARGSGGPAHILLETNHGNQAMLKQIQAAGVPRPSTSSLAYSVYKLLPNDTDLTVFRNHKPDIDGYNIAFIGDPFDYHTALDNPERLNRESVAHQAEYLVSLLVFFATVPELATRSETDTIFFSVPLWQGIVDFPANMGTWLALTAWLLGLLALTLSHKKLKIPWRLTGSATLPLIQTVVICLVLGRYGWLAVQAVIPHVADMSLGYPYSGAYWQAFFTLFSLYIALVLWSRWLAQAGTPPMQNQYLAAALVSNILIWLILTQIVIAVLPGAAFLWLLPLSLSILLLSLVQNILCAPLWAAIILLPLLAFAPLFEQLPVALGLNALFVVTTLAALIAPALLPFTASVPGAAKRLLFNALFLVCAFLLGLALWNTRTSPQRPQQNSLLYLQDNSEKQAWWISFDTAEDTWKQAIMGDDRLPEESHRNIDARLGPWIEQAAAAPYLALPGFAITQSQWTQHTSTQHRLSMHLQPQRRIQRLDLVAGQTLHLHTMRVNGQASGSKQEYRPGQTILRYWFEGNEMLDIELIFSSEASPYFLLYGLSPDLLRSGSSVVPPRPATLVGKPTELTDTLLTRQTLVKSGAYAAIATTQPTKTPMAPQTKSKR